MRPMICVLVAALVVVPHVARAQDAAPASDPPVASAVARVSGPPLRPLVRGRTCCNIRGALVGAAIGAGLGLALSTLCDGGDCAAETMSAMAVGGSIGALFGAFFDTNQQVIPGSGGSFPTRRVRIGAIFRGRTRAIGVAVPLPHRVNVR